MNRAYSSLFLFQEIYCDEGRIRLLSVNTLLQKDSMASSIRSILNYVNPLRGTAEIARRDETLTDPKRLPWAVCALL